MVRRSRKLPVASAGSKPDLIISDIGWQKIENAYGRTLPDAVRGAVLEATDEFIYREALERSVEPAAKAKKFIRGYKKAAGGLQREMLAGVSSDARAYANLLVMRNFQHARLSNEAGSSHVGSVYSLAGLLTSFILACDKALVDLDCIPRKPSVGLLGDLGAPPSIEEGRAWGSLIRRLTGIMKANGLPAGVRKDAGNKSKSDRQSPFTLFVWELQKCLPKGCKYPTQSKSALAKAIGKGRRADVSLAKARWRAE